MSSSFIRGIWGDCLGQNTKIDEDIRLIMENPHNEPFVVYVFGTQNFEYLQGLGLDCRLIEEKPIVYDMQTKLWRHKLDIFRAGMEEFDEIIFLDWDCRPTAPCPENIWEQLRLKAPLQANLLQYRTKRCLWRTEDWRKTCNGGFVYMRDKSIPQAIIDNYNHLCEWREWKKEQRAKRGQKLRYRENALIFDDEPAISKWVDDYCNGWPGLEQYWIWFEPQFCNIKKTAFSENLIALKEECFVHWV